jgi:hypothetical protein
MQTLECTRLPKPALAQEEPAVVAVLDLSSED